MKNTMTTTRKFLAGESKNESKHNILVSSFVVLIVLAVSFSCLPQAKAASLVNGGVISDTISNSVERDSHTFTASAGEYIHIRMADISGSTMIPQIDLYGPSGIRLASNRNDIAEIRLEVTESGDHTVIAYDTNSNGTTRPYDLYFVRAPGANEGGSLPNGGVVSGNLDYGDLDSYTLTASAGEHVHIRMADISGSTMIPRIDLYGPNGTWLASNANDIAEIRLEVTESGTYTVVAYDTNSTVTTSRPYDLYFVLAPGANESGQLSNNEVVFASFDYGDLDSYTFVASTGNSLRIQITDIGGGTMIPRIDLYGPSGAWLKSSAGDIAEIRLDATENGTYTVVAYDTNSTVTTPRQYTLEFDIDRGIDFFSYAALGDSYSSGEGVAPYFDPEDNLLSGLLSGCHRSTRAYSTHLRLPDTSQAIIDQPNTQFDFLACSGAVVKNVTASGEGQNDEPPQLDAVNNVNASRDLVTMTIGGNDAQFVKILAFCLAHDACNEIKPFSPHLDIELGDLFPLWLIVVKTRLLDLYQEIREATPNAATLIMDYPILVGGQECAAAQVPFSEDSKLSASEQAWMQKSNRQLNEVVAQATAKVGLHYIPVAGHFEGHEVCGTLDDWVNGLKPFNPKASFHPTVRGQFEYARVINAYLDSIKSDWPEGYLPNGLPRNPAPLAEPLSVSALNSTLTSTSEEIPTLPSFGDLEVRLDTAPSGCEAAVGIIVPGEMSVIRGTGFAASEPVVLSLVIAGERFSFGTVNADTDGNLDATINIPTSIPVGGIGTVEALAAGPEGVGLLLFDLVRIELAITIDSDGDGIPDGCDNCPNTPNPDQSDIDSDGIGDVCDACPNEATTDEDGDGVCASVDNCTIVANPDQRDTDGDGYGNMCDADLNNDGVVDMEDLGLFKAAFGTNNADADLDGNGIVNTMDLARFRSLFGKTPGPSAVDKQLP